MLGADAVIDDMTLGTYDVIDGLTLETYDVIDGLMPWADAVKKKTAGTIKVRLLVFLL